MTKKQYTYLPLPIDYSQLYYFEEDLKPVKEALDVFLEDIDYMNTLEFSKKVMFSQEIKSNNTVENYYDDISLITNIIKHPSNQLDEEQKRRILNLYHGYQFISQKKEINKDTLRELYRILSDHLLSQRDLSNMGEYYRKDPVYIFYSSRLDKLPDMGIDALEIEKHMEKYFEYLNKDENGKSVSDIFIKSQILHFYFCYVHPYYDINGRTSRTTSMWYLLNHEAYPFIIFNRAIQLDKNYYYKVIREGKIYHNITFFLKYMLKNTQVELEKEYTMEMIAALSNEKLSESDYQALYYILSMKGNWTIYDFASFYNRLNDKKSPNNIYKNMLESLLDKKIIVCQKQSKNSLNNSFFEFAPNVIVADPKIQHLELKKDRF